MRNRLNDASIAGFVSREYDLRPRNLEHVPNERGVGTSCLVIECQNGKTYFLKIYGSSRMARFCAKNLDFTLPATLDLRFKCDVEEIAYPIQSKSGSLQTGFLGRPSVLFNHIEGENLGNTYDLTEQNLKQLARLLAKIHLRTHGMAFRNPIVEDFQVNYEQDFAFALRELSKRHIESHKNCLKEIVLPIRSILLKHMARLRKLGEEAMLSSKAFVLSHGDLWGTNIIRGESDKLHLVDWDGALLAPQERDLSFFIEKGGRNFISIYQSIIGDVKLDIKIIAYYLYNGYLEDLTDWMFKILWENTEDMNDNEDDLQSTVDCLNYSKNIDNRIESVKQILRSI
jgi:thiamine kinase-like enzyme